MPIGFSLDEKGQLWVTEAGTGNNDGSLVLITAAGVKTTVATDFPSVITNGSIEGMSTPLVKDGNLYLLHGVSGKLYTGTISSFKSGDAALPLSHFQSEDIGTYIRSLNLTTDPNSNMFDQVIGPDGNLYIVDAGANAIFKRDKTTKTVTLFAKYQILKNADSPVIDQTIIGLSCFCFIQRTKLFFNFCKISKF